MRLLASILLVIFSSVCFATVPQTINYQGHLAGSGGVPVNAAVDMTFTIYNAATNGTNLWTEDQTVQVNNGIYTVALGAINPIDPVIIDGDLWLGVKVGTDAEMSPRQKLNSVPFALHSATVDQAASVVNGGITVEQIADGAVSNDKLSGQISMNKIIGLSELKNDSQ